MGYSNGIVSVGTAATLICTPGPDGAMVQNLGTATLYLGGPSVTAGTTSTGGIQVGTASPANLVTVKTGTVPGVSGPDDGLYGRVAGGTVNVAFLGAV